MWMINFDMWDNKKTPFFYYTRLRPKGLWTPIVKAERVYHGINPISKVTAR